jgi:hypothetical protein
MDISLIDKTRAKDRKSNFLPPGSEREIVVSGLDIENARPPVREAAGDSKPDS